MYADVVLLVGNINAPSLRSTLTDHKYARKANNGHKYFKPEHSYSLPLPPLPLPTLRIAKIQKVRTSRKEIFYHLNADRNL